MKKSFFVYIHGFFWFIHDHLLVSPFNQICLYTCLQFKVYAKDQRAKTGVRHDLLGMTSSIFKGILLKGSDGSESKWDLMVERLTVAWDEGSMTGSCIMVYITGSRDFR